MAVADTAVVDSDSAPVMLDEGAATRNSAPDGVGRNEKILLNPTIIEPIAPTLDENPTVTITSTSSGLFANSISNFLINRRLQHGKSQSPARMASFSKNLKQMARVSSRNLNVNLARSKLYNSFPNLSRKESQIGQGFSVDDENVQKVLKAVESDHVVSTFGADNRNRRTVYIEKLSGIGKFGFTIQSYTIRHSKTNRTEQITYVDYVDLDGAAFNAGLRAGDIILAINGRNVQSETHQQLVTYIAQCRSLRMVVLFENCVNRIELCARAIKLKKLLADKEFELRMLCCQEQRILSGLPPFTDVEILALLRTPCSTPRSVSFSLPSVENSGTSNGPRPSAPPPRSANRCYVNEDGDKTLRIDDDSRRDYDAFNEQQDVNNIIHYMDVDDIDADLSPAAAIDDDDVRSEFNDDGLSVVSSCERKKPDFLVGSEVGSSARSSSRRSSLKQSTTGSSSIADPGHEEPMSRAVFGHVATGDDLALIHILHIDDTSDSATDTPGNGESPVAITRF